MTTNAFQQVKHRVSRARQRQQSPRGQFTNNRAAHGRQWEHAMPPAFVVLAYAGATLDTLAKELSVLAQQDSDPWIGIDAVCVLNRGIVSWIEPGTSVMFQRMPGSMVFSSSTTPGNVLLSFVTSLNDLLSRARYNERFNIKAYIKGAMGDMSGFWKDGDRYEGISSGEGRQVLRKIDE